jgi:hypothetical protein
MEENVDVSVSRSSMSTNRHLTQAERAILLVVVAFKPKLAFDGFVSNKAATTGHLLAWLFVFYSCVYFNGLAVL